MEQDLNLTIDQGVKELVIRHDKAIVLYEEQKVNLSGTIEAPRLFDEKRKSVKAPTTLGFEGLNIYDPDNTHVRYSKDDMWIEIVYNERDNFKTVVKGTMARNPDLTAFGINDGTTWSRGELQTFLKMNRIHFEKLEANQKIVANLAKFQAQVDKHFDQADDGRGNKTDGYSQTIKTDLDMDFTLVMSPYKSTDKKKFKVEICFDARNNGLDFWFESPELKEIEDEVRDTKMDSELKELKDYVLIEV